MYQDRTVTKTSIGQSKPDVLGQQIQSAVTRAVIKLFCEIYKMNMHFTIIIH